MACRIKKLNSDGAKATRFVVVDEEDRECSTRFRSRYPASSPLERLILTNGRSRANPLMTEQPT
jgi:hypothetical protein